MTEHEYKTGKADDEGIQEVHRIERVLTGYRILDLYVAVPLCIDAGQGRWMIAVGNHPDDLTEFVGNEVREWWINGEEMMVNFSEAWMHMGGVLHAYMDAHRYHDDAKRRAYAKAVAAGYAFALVVRGIV